MYDVYSQIKHACQRDIEVQPKVQIALWLTPSATDADVFLTIEIPLLRKKSNLSVNHYLVRHFVVFKRLFISIYVVSHQERFGQDRSRTFLIAVKGKSN